MGEAGAGRAGSTGALRVHLPVYALLLALLALLSWLGRGWGYLVFYALLLAAFGLVVGVVRAGLARRRGAGRARAFVARALRSFARAQGTLALALVATAVLARATSGPVGPFAGGPFEGSVSQAPFEADRMMPEEAIALQIPGDPPYTITAHAFWIEQCLYVGADFAFPFKRWVHRVEDAPVVVRIGDRLFERRAVRVREPRKSRALLEEVSRRRGVDPEDWLTEVWFFRMGCAE